MTASYDFLDTSPVIPVIAIEAIEHAVPLAEALVAGGIVNLEVTLRTQYGIDAIRLISEQVPGANVGVGTVCSAGEFDAAVDAGASFVVSPGQSDELFERALLTDVPFLPGAVTATEVMAAKSAGFTILKFFPAGTSGGAAAIKAFSGPFADIQFVPTGGIKPENAHEYLSLSNVRAVGGTWLTPTDLIKDGRWDEIEAIARQASSLNV
ncbi:Entner-Doudoroff aldolase [gamma proteobacterium HIMB55]|nr:Entner-Doudoroff aldolase [gamma proteobacterium HIMB55]